MLEICKYKNRRLYDKEKSQYIKLDTLKEYVLAGKLFRVVDSETKEDLTAQTLLQILLEMHNSPASLLSPELLRQFIVMAEHPMSQKFQATLEQLFQPLEEGLRQNPVLHGYQQAMDTWQTQVEQMTKQWQSWLKTK